MDREICSPEVPNMKANKKIIVTYFALYISIGFGQPATITNFTKSVQFVPPANFQLEDYLRDSGLKDWPTDLFKYRGSGVQYDATNEGDTILFMLEPSDYVEPHLNGKFPGPLFPRSSTDLKTDFDKYYHGFVVSIPNLSGAKIGKTARYTSVSASAQFSNSLSPTNYFYACWIQIKSNIVVTITIASTSGNTFAAATNSLETLKINKKEIINIVRPSEWQQPQD
jgi:hypothetical protein